MKESSERVALVAGATGTLGRELARTMASSGVRLGLVGRDRERLHRLASDLGLADDRWVGIAADLRDQDAARDAVASVRALFGRLDIVAHVVGGWTGGTPTAQVNPAEFRSMLEQHLWTTVHVARAALPVMVDAGWGRIVAVSSPVASTPAPGMAPYAVAKAAQEALLATLAREAAGTGVTVNVVVVRSIRAAGLQPDATRKARGTAVEDVAAAIRWLCSEAAGAVNGARIALHGAA